MWAPRIWVVQSFIGQLLRWKGVDIDNRDSIMSAKNMPDDVTKPLCVRMKVRLEQSSFVLGIDGAGRPTTRQRDPVKRT